MADKEIDQDDPKQDASTKNEPPSGGESEKEQANPVPYARFQEVNEGKKAVEAELAKFREAEAKRIEADEAAKKKQLEDQNKFKELYESAESEKEQATASVTTLTERVGLLEQALETQWESQKELIPEMFRDLVGGMPIEERIKWLSANAEKLTEKNKGGGTPRRTARRDMSPPTVPNGSTRRSTVKF